MIHTDYLIQASEDISVKKALGKFYTPPFIAADLIEDIFSNFNPVNKEAIRIVDPFCGDGRLLVAFLKAHYLTNNCTRLEIEGWDYDPNATKAAQHNLKNTVEELKIENVSISIISKDSFLNSQEMYESFDIVITNPPWETIKPDRRDLKGLTQDKIDEYKCKLREYDISLGSVFPFSIPTRKFAGWGTNLSRCGLELSLKLTANKGICSIVLPSSLLMDQTSTPLRKWVVEQATLVKANIYPAESKLFKHVDQDSTSLTFIKGSPEETFVVNTKRYDKQLNIQEHAAQPFNCNELKASGFSIPIVHGHNSSDILFHFKQFKQLSEYESAELLRLGREIDETRLSSYLIEKGRFSFVKGKMVERYKLQQQTSLYVSEDLKKIPESAFSKRIAWRDVSRKTQMRRMQATIVEPMYVTGNSLNIALIKNEDENMLIALLVLMNSFAFEFQVRSLSNSGHISTGIVRQVRIPAIESLQLIGILGSAYRAYQENQLIGGEITLEVLAAISYNLTAKEFLNVLEYFPKISPCFKDELVRHPLWEHSSIYSPGIANLISVN